MENYIYLSQLCGVFGWQGGTIHQVIAEVKKIKADNEKLKQALAKQVCEPMQGISFKQLLADTQCDGCKKYDICVLLTETE